MRRRRAAWPAVLEGAGALLVVFATAAPAAAQVPPPSGAPEDEARRTALYRDGYEAANAGRWAEAKERFTAALAIRTSPKVLFSLAQVEERLDQLVGARRDYLRAMEAARASGEGDVALAAEGALSSLERRVPTLRIVVDGEGAATAAIDGVPVSIGTPVQVDPGSRQVVVSAPRMSAARSNVAIAEGQHLDVPIRLEAVPSEPAPITSAPPSSASDAYAGPVVEPDRSGSPWRTVALVGAGTGAVALGIGGYFGLHAKSENDQSYSSGCSGNHCTPEAASIRRDALSAANASTSFFIVGGALAAGGLVLWLVAPSASGDGGMGVAPVALGSGSGLALRGGWR
jgi:hypothetical protein